MPEPRFSAVFLRWQLSYFRWSRPSHGGGFSSGTVGLTGRPRLTFSSLDAKAAACCRLIDFNPIRLRPHQPDIRTSVPRHVVALGLEDMLESGPDSDERCLVALASRKLAGGIGYAKRSHFG